MVALSLSLNFFGVSYRSFFESIVFFFFGPTNFAFNCLLSFTLLSVLIEVRLVWSAV